MERSADKFAITCQWLDQDCDTAMDAALCALKIAVADHVLTRNISCEDGAISETAVVSAWPLAAWLADNWWRLLYETGSGGNWFQKPYLSLEWKTAHSLIAADYGFQWPNIQFVSDAGNVSVKMWPDKKSDVRLARYDGQYNDLVVGRQAFADGILEFLQCSSEHLKGRYAADPLRELIEQLFIEIDDESIAEYRMIEAMTGYNPDEAPEDVIKYGREIINKFGMPFFRDIASAINRSFLPGANPVESLENIIDAAAQVDLYGVKGKFDLDLPFEASETVYCLPWQYGGDMARKLREKLGMDANAKIDTSILRDWFSISENDFRNAPSNGENGICHFEDEKLCFRFANESSWQYSQNRRFFLARLVAALLENRQQNKWFAIGPGATWDQKMQRAFAVELLAPFEGIKQSLHAPQRIDRVMAERLAKHYDVSLLTIINSLANHRVISRSQAYALVA